MELGPAGLWHIRWFHAIGACGADSEIAVKTAQLKNAIKPKEKIQIINPDLQKKYTDEVLKLHTLEKGVLQEDDGKDH